MLSLTTRQVSERRKWPDAEILAHSPIKQESKQTMRFNPFPSFIETVKTNIVLMGRPLSFYLPRVAVEIAGAWLRTTASASLYNVSGRSRRGVDDSKLQDVELIVKLSELEGFTIKLFHTCARNVVSSKLVQYRVYVHSFLC